jgi:hypothetical protein
MEPDGYIVILSSKKQKARTLISAGAIYAYAMEAMAHAMGECAKY